jgi:hypothetical protein
VIQFRSVNKGDLPGLPDKWEWIHCTRDRWMVWKSIGHNVDVELTEDGHIRISNNKVSIPPQIIRALYMANGVEL